MYFKRKIPVREIARRREAHKALVKRLPKEGDVIMSPKFSYGSYPNGEDKKYIVIRGDTKKTNLVEVCLKKNERLAIVAKSEKVPSKTKMIDLGAYDTSRAKAKFVVEKVKTRKEYDRYFEWHVIARRLNKDGSYNPDGETINFEMLIYNSNVRLKDIQIVGKMRRWFI